MKTKKFNVVFVALIFSFAILILAGCEKNITQFETIFPESYKIVVRVNNNSDYSEETFIYDDNKYYYKYVNYTVDFEEQGSVCLERMVIINNTNYEHYSFDQGTSQWNCTGVEHNFSQAFESAWAGLNIYCKAPTSPFYTSEKQADGTVNNWNCFVFIVGSNIYKISKSLHAILLSYYAPTSDNFVQYEVQTIITADVFNGISTAGILE